MLPQQIAFGVLSAAMVLAALRLVTTKNMVRAALFLTMVLAGAAGQFILLAAEFVAIAQVIVYVGAIVVIFLFGIMLTRAPIGKAADVDNDQRWLAGIVALFLAGVLSAVVLDGFPLDDAHKLRDTRLAAGSTDAIGDSIFSTYVVPFEVVSVLLLAALVGAIVIARRD